jgi:hypothetical protein
MDTDGKTTRMHIRVEILGLVGGDSRYEVVKVHRQGKDNDRDIDNVNRDEVIVLPA